MEAPACPGTMRMMRMEVADAHGAGVQGGGAVQWPAAHDGETLQRVPSTAQAGETPGHCGLGTWVGPWWP